MVFGPLVSWIIRALEGAVVVGGLSALSAGLYSLGTPKNSVVEYEKALKSDACPATQRVRFWLCWHAWSKPTEPPIEGLICLSTTS
jgi:hypothetical protein